MRRYNGFVIAVSVLMMIGLARPAQANFLDDATHWAKKTYNSARDEAEKVAKAAEHAAKQAQESAQYISEKAMEETVQLSKQAANGIQDAANQMADLVKNFGKIGKNCEAALNEFGDTFMNQMPALPQMSMVPGFPVALEEQRCRMYMNAGFTCGIFPYLDGIARSIATGSADTKKLAQYVNHAYGSNACKHINVLDRPMCALIMGIAKASEESMSCMANVIADTVENGGKGHPSISDDQIKGLCNMMGEFAFSFAVDQLALGAAEGQDLQKLVKLAQKLRSVLVLQSHVEDSKRVQDVCENGAKSADGKSGFTAPVPVDDYADILSQEPNAHLLMMKSLESDMCLDGYGAPVKGDRQVQLYKCHGKSNQRWSFHKTTRTDNNLADRGFYYIMNDHYGTCVASTKDGLFLKKCDQGYNEQLFTVHQKQETVEKKNDDGSVTKTKVWKNTGMLVNLHTGKCAGVTVPDKDLKDEMRLHEYDCDDPKLNAVWYVNDPMSDVLTQNPGAHLHVYAYPESPFCMQGNSNDKVSVEVCGNTARQMWSFHVVRDGKYNQLWNDHWGPGGCLHSGGGNIRDTFVIKKCDDRYNEQLFTVLPNGKVKNLHTGYCLNIFGGYKKAGTRVINWPCEDTENELWYRTERE